MFVEYFCNLCDFSCLKMLIYHNKFKFNNKYYINAYNICKLTTDFQ